MKQGEEQTSLPNNMRYKKKKYGIEVIQGPYYFNSTHPPRVETPKMERSRINNSLRLIHWNARGINQREKVNIINSINCDLFALQETGHPRSEFLDLIHRTRIGLKEREPSMNGGGTLTLSDLNITSKTEFEVNKDTVLQRIVIDGVFVLWLGNIYLNKGSSKQIQRLC